MIGGTSVKAFPVPPLPSLAEMAEGTLVKVNENGAPVEFYVAKHDYESELNGAGRTLVVRKDVYDQRQRNSSNVNTWESCTLREWLNGDYKGILDIGIQQLIATTTYRYTPGGSNMTVTTRADAVFQLSLTELGPSYTYANVEGSVLPIASTLRADTANQWTRSPYTYYTNGAWWLNSGGGVGNGSCGNSYGSRPAFTLPSTVLVDEAMNIVA